MTLSSLMGFRVQHQRRMKMSEKDIHKIWAEDIPREAGPPCPKCGSEIYYWLSGPNTGKGLCSKCDWNHSFQSSKEV